jgi:hypothetical protein
MVCHSLFMATQHIHLVYICKVHSKIGNLPQKWNCSTRQWAQSGCLLNGCLAAIILHSFWHEKTTKINLSAIGKFYTVSALLQNAHTCLYGNIVAHFFELSPPTLEHYFSWRTIEIKHLTLELIIILTFYTWINNYIIAIFFKLNKLTLR